MTVVGRKIVAQTWSMFGYSTYICKRRVGVGISTDASFEVESSVKVIVRDVKRIIENIIRQMSLREN